MRIFINAVIYYLNMVDGNKIYSKALLDQAIDRMEEMLASGINCIGCHKVLPVKCVNWTKYRDGSYWVYAHCDKCKYDTSYPKAYQQYKSRIPIRSEKGDTYNF